jgi:hypothetical protein
MPAHSELDVSLYALTTCYSVWIDSHIYMFLLGLILLEPAESLGVQVHHLVSLGGWNDVTSVLHVKN